MIIINYLCTVSKNKSSYLAVKRLAQWTCGKGRHMHIIPMLQIVLALVIGSLVLYLKFKVHVLFYSNLVIYFHIIQIALDFTWTNPSQGTVWTVVDGLNNLREMLGPVFSEEGS